jgi:hypothetical protein
MKQEDPNPFELLYQFESDDSDNIINHKEVEAATKEIENAVRIFVKEMERIEKKYHLGIGDTETDEAITGYLYDKLHSFN